jgi:hypothetical protein
VTAHSAISHIPRLAPAEQPRHRAFMQVLAEGTASTADWFAARAALLVLRYVDAWASGEWLPVQLLAERAAVADAIGAVPAGDQYRGLLPSYSSAQRRSGR